MFNSSQFQDLSNKIKDIVKTSPLADVDKNIHALIKGALTKMELVTREEFDVQTEVLRHAREQLESLETKLAGLEKQILKESISSEQIKQQ
ncbi:MULTISPECIES: accessory factor UbiK family protein [Methylotenera]|uniref:accessory factor UbiK family protein n=1 Tax=Methylotenera TaxID=359407 RepID=UPI000381B692|nr:MULTISPECIES: accessory factor UbiK family protein [Methylotenera]